MAELEQRAALQLIADMDPEGVRADDLGRAAGIARAALGVPAAGQAPQRGDWRTWDVRGTPGVPASVATESCPSCGGRGWLYRWGTGERVNCACVGGEPVAVAGVKASQEPRPPLDVNLPERVIDQLVAESGFTYVEPSEQDVYDLAQAIKREVLARIPNAWLTPTAGVKEADRG